MIYGDVKKVVENFHYGVVIYISPGAGRVKLAERLKQEGLVDQVHLRGAAEAADKVVESIVEAARRAKAETVGLPRRRGA